MIRAIKNILFTTKLSAECKHAYNYAISLATRYQGSITLLHVIEKLPISIESSLSNFLGQDRWERVVLEQVKNARASLTGKITDHELVEIALERFCEDSKIGVYPDLPTNITALDKVLITFKKSKTKVI